MSFRHKGLQLLYQTGSKRGIQPEHERKLTHILSVLDEAREPKEAQLPSFKLHQLTGSLAGHWSIWVNGNWRVTFRFVGQDVELVDYQDYH